MLPLSGTVVIDCNEKENVVNRPYPGFVETTSTLVSSGKIV